MQKSCIFAACTLCTGQAIVGWSAQQREDAKGVSPPLAQESFADTSHQQMRISWISRMSSAELKTFHRKAWKGLKLVLCDRAESIIFYQMLFAEKLAAPRPFTELSNTVQGKALISVDGDADGVSQVAPVLLVTAVS